MEVFLKGRVKHFSGKPFFYTEVIHSNEKFKLTPCAVLMVIVMFIIIGYCWNKVQWLLLLLRLG